MIQSKKKIQGKMYERKNKKNHVKQKKNEGEENGDVEK